MGVRVIAGDCRDVLKTLPAQSVQCCVTSPPYFGLRDYGVAGQIGLEPTPDEYVAEMVEVFRGVRHVLQNDGTAWLNIGDTSRNKQLLMIPARVAIALQADGWYLRADIVWHKPNVMPESVTDRPTSAHEHVFLLAKRKRYFYDARAIREPDSGQDHRRGVVEAIDGSGGHLSRHTGIRTAEGRNGQGRNCRNVWTIRPYPFSGAHFATMPPELAERCIKAGSRPGDTVLDPFGGAGTTGLVAGRLGRNAVLIDLNVEYTTLIHKRLAADAPLFAMAAE